MQNDLATLNSQPKKLTVDGKSYEIHPLTLNDFAKLQRWVDDQQTDPIDLVMNRADQFTPAQHKFMLQTALELASKPKPKIGTEVADELVRSIEGTKELLYLTISKGDPTFSRETAEGVFAKLSMADIARLYRDTDAEKVLSDPKAPTGTTTSDPAPSPSTGG